MALYKIKGAENSIVIEGTITQMKRDNNNKLIFYLRHCNLIDNRDNSADKNTLHISEYPFSFAGPAADKVERDFENGSLVRVEGFVSQSEDKGNIKFKGRFVVPAIGIYKTGEELGI